MAFRRAAKAPQETRTHLENVMRGDPLGDATAVVIGAGAAGLAAALELSAAGLRVHVLERAARPGGKIRATPSARGGVDAGPTVFTMRWVFDELFERIGARLEDHLSLKPLETLARHAWDGAGEGGVFDLPADPSEAADAIGRFAGPRDAEGYRAFCARAKEIYAHLERRFIAAQRPTPISLIGRLGPGPLARMLALSPPISLWRVLGRHLADQRLRQLFARYATYCGSSPFLAPSTLMLVAHVEQSGVWRLEGGMAALPKALSALAVARGVDIRCGAHVDRIEVSGGRACGVTLAGGERISANVVVMAGDPAALAAGLFGEAAAVGRPAARKGRSLSALVWTGATAAAGFSLSHHNVFFSSAYRDEFDRIFSTRALPLDPTTYVCAQDRGGDLDAVHDGGAAERIQILVNAPADGDAPGPGLSVKEIDACQKRTQALLARAGLSLDISALTRTSPEDFHQMFPGTGGALYGPANHALLATFRRPGARTAAPGLYLASGAAHPGPGVPMATLSGRLAAQAALEDLASSKRRRPAAISGGMSTA